MSQSSDFSSTAFLRRSSAIRRSRDGAAGRAEVKRQPWPVSTPRARSTARTASLPRAGGRHLPLWGGAPSKSLNRKRCLVIDRINAKHREISLIIAASWCLSAHAPQWAFNALRRLEKLRNDQIRKALHHLPPEPVRRAECEAMPTAKDEES